MTDTTDTTNTIPDDPQDAASDPQDAPVTPDAPEVTGDAPDALDADDAHDDKPGREAAKYRRRLREAETERDSLRGQLDALRRVEVDRILTAENRPAKGSLIFAAGTTMADMLAEDGTVDPALVLAALDRAGDSLGIRVKLPAAPSAVGQGNVGRSIYDGKPEPRFADAFRPR